MDFFLSTNTYHNILCLMYLRLARYSPTYVILELLKYPLNLSNVVSIISQTYTVVLNSV